VTTRRPVVVVVGGGIAGLAAAWELATGDRAAEIAPEIHVLEAGDHLGGCLRSAEFAGRTVDLAADAFLARRPEATELCAELGLTGELVAPGTSGASVWARGRLRRMPDGLNLGVPTRWWPLARSGILNPAESLRVARDLVQPHFGARGVVGDRAVGAIVEPRLGRPVVERLVDPLVGGINAGRVDDLSAAAAFPYLLAASLQPGSLMRRLGRNLRDAATPAGEEGPPVFWSLTAGTAGLAERLSAELERHGVRLRTRVSLEAIRRPVADRDERNGSGPRRWQLDVRSDREEVVDADGIVLAVPADVAGVQLAVHTPELAGLLSTIEYASVAVLTLAFPPDAIDAPLHGTGFLVPRTATVGGTRPLVTAATYLGRKWPHLARPGDELIRVSVGSSGDDRHRSLSDGELTDAVLLELGHLLGVRDRPVDGMVTRFDHAFPQYRVGHLIRVARIEQGLAALDGIELAGAAYRGLGIPACIGSGREAARRLCQRLPSPAASDPTPAPQGNGHR
jgi:oxygen-dependent protoporphyrinogen oxidase